MAIPTIKKAHSPPWPRPPGPGTPQPTGPPPPRGSWPRYRPRPASARAGRARLEMDPRKDLRHSARYFATSLSAPHFRAQLENGRNPLAESPNHCPRATCAQIGLSSLATSWSGRGAYQPSRVGPDRPAPARRVALYSANQPHPLFEDLSWRFAMSLGRLGLTFGSCFRLPFTVFAQGHNLERGGVLGCDRSLNTVDE